MYEWNEGEPRPGTVHKHRNYSIDILEIPREGLPNVNDIVLLYDHESNLSRYQVISREFLWSRSGVDDHQSPAEYSKVMIYVRKLTFEEYRGD
jgi:hypothetical protein